MVEDKTGTKVIDKIGDIPWGTHICLFYRTAHDLIDILAPYFKAGLENNELCMWITSDPLNAADAKRSLEQVVKNLDDCLQRGQIEILDYRQWYIQSGEFDPNRILRGLFEKERQAVQSGWDGLRLTGNTFWLEKKNWQEFSAYEVMVDQVINKHRIVAICAYSLDKCGASEVIDVVSNHQSALVKRGGRWVIIESATRKAIEQSLHESEERFHAVAKSANEAIVVTDGEGKIVSWNKGAQRIFLYDEEEILGQNVSVLMPERYRVLHLEALKLLHSNGQDRNGGKTYEAHGLRQDGSEFPIEISLAAGETAKSKFYSAIMRDITQRKRVLAALERRAAQLSLLSEVGKKIVATLELESMLDRAACLIQESFGYHHVALFYLDSEREELVLKARAGDFARLYPPEPSIKLGRGMVGWVGQHGEKLLVNDVRVEPRYINYYPATIPILSELCLPIRMDKEIMGVMDIQSPRHNEFDEDDVLVLETLADQILVAIENARLFEEVRAGRERLQSLSRQLVKAQEAERRRIARELHDEIGQALTLLKLSLEMSARLPTEVIRANLAETKERVGELLTRVRILSHDLRPAMLDDLGLLPALLWLFERYTAKTQVQVDFKHVSQEGLRFSPDIETAAYRIVQEALTNIARHADVSQAIVRLWIDQDKLNVQIEDHGTGFDPMAVMHNGRSSGLPGMYERARSLGGQLRVESSPGTGACISAELPLSKCPEEEARDR